MLDDMARLTLGRLLFNTFVIALLLYFFVISSKSLFGGRGYDILSDEHGRFASSNVQGFSSQVRFGEKCSPFTSGAMDDITIVLKFGAPEVAVKLPSYLNTLVPCKPDLLLFSDRQDSIDGIEIVDALANLHFRHKHKNPDFQIYDEIHRSNGTRGRTIEGWRLDKYKFLPMMEHTASLRPESKWYVFLELDTYVNWDNLYRFLSRFHPTKAHYFGSPVWPKGKPVFAHGGTGFVLSHRALSKLVARGKIFAEDHMIPGSHLFGRDFQKECCGDEVLAQVLKEAGVILEGYWPNFNGEKVSSLPFGHEHWCEAMITLHHLEEKDFDIMRRFESMRQFPERPLTFKELFDSIEPSLKYQVDDWSNLSDDITMQKGNDAWLSVKACHDACLEDIKCVQWQHFGVTCRLSHSFRLGHKQPPDGDKRWTSGWMEDRIKSFRDAQSECREGAHLVHSNP